ncbi:MAG: hypothetical protein IPH80_29690 [Myxococcales bacterium]|nr:hypothetical protein [Myxococcales bacterium]
MAIVGGTLYVADISVVRQFDLATGAAKGEIKVDGAAFLNDVAATADGGVVVTDTSVDEKFASLGNDAIYKIGADGKVSTVIKDKALGGPNGVSVAADGTLWVVSFSSGEIAAVDAKGVKQPGQKLPKGQLDGIEALARRRLPGVELGGRRGLPRQARRRVEAGGREPEGAGRHRRRQQARLAADPAVHREHGALGRDRAVSAA